MAGSKKSEITRRDFISGAVAAGASLSVLGLPRSAKSETPVPKPTSEQLVTYSFQACPRNCHDTCTLISEVVDGRIRRITGDPSNPITAGTPCVKGHCYLTWVYHPERVLRPLKRIGKKGEGKWQPISWDEALDTIASRMRQIVKTYGAEAILPYNYSGNLGIVQNYAPQRFWNRLGSSKLNRAVCAGAGEQALRYTYGQVASIDPESYARTNLFVSWGVNQAATNVHVIKFINQARDNGAKLVEINPVRTPLASQADLYLQPYPGTDAALALGIANIIISEHLFQRTFVEQYTLGFEHLAKKAAYYSLDRVERITRIPQAKIREFAHLYAAARPSILRIGYGMQRNSNGGQMVRAISLLPTLTGVVGMDAGGFIYINSEYWAYDWKAVQRPDLLGNRTPRSINMNELGKALNGETAETRDNPIHCLLVYDSNPVAIATNTNRVRDGLKREDLFTVVVDPFLTDTADYADIVLPAATFFEYEDINSDYLGWYVRHNTPAIPPLGESKSNWEIFSLLAARLGFTEQCFSDSAGDIIRASLKSGSPLFKGITYEAIREKHWMKINAGAPFSNRRFKTPSGKIEFFSADLARAGFDPVAEHQSPAEGIECTPELFARFPLRLVSPASKNLLSSQYSNLPYLRELNDEQYILIHPTDAKKRNIQDGEQVYVFNNRGQVRLRAQVTKAVGSGVIMAPKAPWAKLSLGSTNINALAPDALGDMAGISTYHTNLVQVSCSNQIQETNL